MGLNDFILNCEKDNKELKKDIEYYKNKSKRLEKQLQQREEVIEEVKEHVRYLRSLNNIYFCDIEPLEKILDKYKKEESE